VIDVCSVHEERQNTSDRLEKRFRSPKDGSAEQRNRCTVKMNVSLPLAIQQRQKRNFRVVSLP
jgi:hypothetical protein